MSWSISRNGDSVKVAAEVEADCASMTALPGPEEAIKQSARALIAQTLAAQTPNRTIMVSAWGTQITSEAATSNGLHININ
jgi:hypothetical protein